jgi:hypothetical protein
MIRLGLKLLAVFLLSIFSSQVVLGQAETENKTNELFLRESIQEHLKQTLTDFPKESPRFIFIHSEAKHPASWLLDEELTSYLTSKGFPVALPQKEFKSENFGKSWELSYRIIELKLEYTKTKSKNFLGKRFLTRRSDLNLSFRLMEKDTGKILWTNRKNYTRSDVIPKKTIPGIENENYPFLSPNLPKSTTSKYIEPALVAAVVGGLVYLFFASR